MKKLLLASVALTVAATAAMAADAPVRHKRYVKAPVYKAPPVYIPPAYDFSGMYIGGHIGWGNIRDSVTTVGAPYALNSDQFIGGIQAGYNFMVAPHIMLGFEGEFTWLTQGYSANFPIAPAPTVVTYSANPDWVATAAGRLGYTQDKMMIYAKGGVAWLDSKYGAFVTPAAGTAFSSNNTVTGYVVGGGLEYGISQAWTAKLEYAYLDFGTTAYTVGFGGANGVKTDMQQLKIGLNYKLNGFSIGKSPSFGEPVSAKY